VAAQEGPSSCACGPNADEVFGAALYDAGEAAGAAAALGASLGCGVPTAVADLREGETVLDLGSGAGGDVLISARRVGSAGRAIGLDMTDDMLALANANRDKLGATNVEFRKGEMESMPIEDAKVDVIISNCVINLSPDKDAVFRESFRVLAPGGRFHVSDIVLSRELSKEERDDLSLWAGCAAGALLESDYLGRLVQAGFTKVSVDSRSKVGEKPWYSATISAHKPRTTGGCC